MARVDFEAEVFVEDLEGDEVKFIVSLECVLNSRPAVMYHSNGDPGYPAEAAEYETVRIYFEDDTGRLIAMTDKEIEDMIGGDNYWKMMERAWEQADDSGEF